MPEERVDVTPQGDSSPPPEASNGQPPEDRKSPGPVPYERFKEVNERAKAAQAAIDRQQQQIQELSGQVTQFRTVAQTLATQMQQQQQKPADPAEPAADPYEQYLQQQLGEDEQGKKAREIMDAHAQWWAKKNGFVTQDQVQQMVQGAEGRTLNKINSTFSVSANFQALIEKGILSPELATKYQGQLTEYVKQYPQVADNPQLVTAAIDRLVMDGLTRGEVKPGTPRVTPVLQPGNGQGPAPAGEPEVFEPGKLPFRRVRGMDPERVKLLVERSSRNYERALK